MSLKPFTGAGTGLVWTKSSHSSNDGPACVEVAWVKSSYSTNDGPDCVEVGWTKSTHSGSNNNDCVEVKAGDEAILVRDSKDPDGPRIEVTPTEWSAFLAYAASCEV
jgi:hypothetical protein